ncbi:hypothetical protein F511_39463 [Dorcoceras hygrometricum]|uniref:Uncharacterized protein n=1 Tax=Dorcoceras hygrometricum TaxID=472368 RepID=A0A2Z7BX91_9LAMI|nr:hypothetical protein F511_39463 [Dorcoceras hygrometricum]
MSRYFFIKRISSTENPWGCDMSWRDDAHTLSPPTPKHALDLTTFLEAMREKCFNAQELIEEDLLCHFSFSGKKVQLVGDLDDRMSTAEMMKSLKERRSDPEGTSRCLHPSKGKRKATSEGGERCKKRRPEEETQDPARATISKGPTSESRGTAGKAPEQESTEAPYVLLDTSTISFVAKPSGSVLLDFIRRLVPDQDFDLVRSVPDLAALEAASLHLMQALVWSGEVSNRLAQARDEVVTTKHSLDGVFGRHNDLM